MSKNQNHQGSDLQTDPVHWRSLNQLEGNAQFTKFEHREFQEGASELLDPVSRRSFLKVMGAGVGLAGMQACRRPVEKILPYSKTPEDLIPGVPQHYATTFSVGTDVFGVIVESHEGRPTKVEGNPDHPFSFGASDAFAQASVLDLYDPDRQTTPKHKGLAQTWEQFAVVAKKLSANYHANEGAGLAIISETITSPTLAALRADLMKAMPKALWVSYDPINEDNSLGGAQLAFGQSLRPLYDYSKADVVVSIGADFMGTDPGHLRAVREFAQKRNVKNKQMNRLYAIESTFSLTGSNADHRLRLQSKQLFSFVQALAHELFVVQNLETPAGINSSELQQSLVHADGRPFSKNKPWIAALAKDLMKHRGSSLVVVGEAQPLAAHALAHVINDALKNVGTTVQYFAVPEAQATLQSEQLKMLATALDKKAIETLIILGGNPAYNLPADIRFKESVEKIAHTIHLSGAYDETSALSEWHLPRAHALEAWGDAVARDGTRSIVQPLIEPLYDGKSDIELISWLLRGEFSNGYKLVRNTWQIPLDFEKYWRNLLYAGLDTKSAGSPVKPTFSAKAIETFRRPLIKESNDLEINFLPSAQTYDGRYANVPWLQELPEPMTKLTWDNVFLVSPRTAKELHLASEDVVRVSLRGHAIEAPVWVQPGQADHTLSIALGYGRTHAGYTGNRVGVDVYPLRFSNALWFDSGVTLTKTIKTYPLSATQDHHSMEGRPIVREATLEEFFKEPTFAEEMVEHPPLLSLYKEHDYSKGHQWGMTIDLNTCVGCNGCMVACQAENNIPTVGKEQVANGREMHWLRMDRYFTGDVDDPQTVHQPVACQQCENAPCEQVCPVAATAHSPEGLNDMAYNRCVGTRYCSNNCPFKVRRFNFLAWHNDEPETHAMQHNPNVTVRMRGVMEKCTYCVQRINSAKITAKVQGKPLVDGDIKTACQQACPANAIVFGDINDHQSRVTELKKSPRRYEMLAELNIKPRTSFLAKIRNPNPELL